MSKIWFKRKKYGWGWVPATWEGWFVLIDYVVALLLLAWYTAPSSVISVAVPFAVLTAVLLLIVYMKGETPRWQWNDDNDTDAKP